MDIECLINGHKSRWPKKSPLAVTLRVLGTLNILTIGLIFLVNMKLHPDKQNDLLFEYFCQLSLSILGSYLSLIFQKQS